MRRRSSLLVLALVVVAACGSRSRFDSGQSFPVPAQTSTAQSGYAGTEPKVELAKTGVDRWTLTVYQGQKATGGYAIAIERIVTMGTGLHVRARFSAPAGDAIVTTVVTSPASSVDLPFAPDAIYLYDQDDRERARLER
jgi:hypothetical protein